jgi:DNA replication ATP-dependent helicase Dna2
MPGTGKTSTMAHVVRQLYVQVTRLQLRLQQRVSPFPQGKTVLVTAHTHAAVDNMLLAIQRLCVPVHRVGRSESVHSAIEERVITGPIIDVLLQMKGSAAAASTGCVIGCTCLGVQVRFQVIFFSKL